MAAMVTGTTISPRRDDGAARHVPTNAESGAGPALGRDDVDALADVPATRDVVSLSASLQDDEPHINLAHHVSLAKPRF